MEIPFCSNNKTVSDGALGIEAVAPNETSCNWDYKRKARPRFSRGETPKKNKKIKERNPRQDQISPRNLDRDVLEQRNYYYCLLKSLDVLV